MVDLMLTIARTGGAMSLMARWQQSPGASAEACGKHNILLWRMGGFVYLANGVLAGGRRALIVPVAPGSPRMPKADMAEKSRSVEPRGDG